MADAEARLDSFERLAERRDEEDVDRSLLVTAAFKLDAADAASRDLVLESLAEDLAVDTPTLASAIDFELINLFVETKSLAAATEDENSNEFTAASAEDCVRTLVDEDLRFAVVSDADNEEMDIEDLRAAAAALDTYLLFDAKIDASVNDARADDSLTDSELRIVLTSLRLASAKLLLTAMSYAA